jgi:glutaconate CoA-transferase subunit B
MRHDKRRFVEKIDFISTPGYLDGPGSREWAGLPPGTGPYRVVTNLGIMGYHPVSKRMMLLAIQPGVEIDEVLENTGFELLLANDVIKNPPPKSEELRILREEVDKDRLYI